MRLFAEDDTLGALNLYSREPVAFGEHARNTGTVSAAHTGVATVAARVQERAENPADQPDHRSRDRYHHGAYRSHPAGGTGVADHDLANLNTKLHDLADTIVETGELPS
jgi:hypothetical protein